MKNVTVRKYARPFPTWKRSKFIFLLFCTHTHTHTHTHTQKVYLDFKGNLCTIYEIMIRLLSWWRGIVSVSLYCTFYESGKGKGNMETAVSNCEELFPIFRKRERERGGGLSWGRWTNLPRLILCRKRKAVFRWGGPQSKQIRTITVTKQGESIQHRRCSMQTPPGYRTPPRST